MSKPSSSVLTPSAQSAAPPPKLTPGHDPWDDWRRAALEARLPADLAGLGRAVMREAYRRDWPPRLKSLCGWRDGGGRMLKFALRSPGKARYRWQRLIESEGGRRTRQEGRWFSRS
jgi:hypothetical protein